MQLKNKVADVQSTTDHRNLAIDRVGVRRLRHPMIFEDPIASPAISQPVVGEFSLYVNLAPDRKGTHMSRFLEILNEKPVALSMATLGDFAQHIAERLNAKGSYFSVTFPLFLEKAAPISGATSLLDYQLTLEGHFLHGKTQIDMTLLVPVTSLCPCSKAISDFGAHNQRSHITVTLRMLKPFSIAKVIRMIEQQASGELYGILKRTDEKAVTERAYLNPKFVEDMVRDIANKLSEVNEISGYKIASENFESIHNHSAFAEIDKLTVTSSGKANKLTKEINLPNKQEAGNITC